MYPREVVVVVVQEDGEDAAAAAAVRQLKVVVVVVRDVLQRVATRRHTVERSDDDDATKLMVGSSVSCIQRGHTLTHAHTQSKRWFGLCCCQLLIGSSKRRTHTITMAEGSFLDDVDHVTTVLFQYRIGAHTMFFIKEETWIPDSRFQIP